MIDCDWPEYESHRGSFYVFRTLGGTTVWKLEVVRAAKIFELVYDKSAGQVVSVIVVPDGGEPEEFTPTHASMLGEAAVGGWAVVYPDGFRSISPAHAFKQGNTRKAPA